MILDHEEYERWVSMAEYTLRSASKDLEGGFYSWACFKAYQCGDYAVKALLRGLGSPAYGRSILSYW